MSSNPVHCYADDSTLHNAPASHKNRADIASLINLDLCKLKNWGSQNLVNFNAGKTQCCLISRRVDRNLPNISFDSNSLEFRDKISMLGVTLGSDLSWNDHISTIAKAAARKLGLDAVILPVNFLYCISPCLEYGSHLWRGSSKHSLATLDAIQKRAIKLIGDPALTNSLDSLAHRRTVSALSLYYRYYHGVCSVELKSIIPPNALFTRNTRFSNAQHPFAVKLDKSRTSAFANSFIPMISRDWNSLPATIFPATYNLQLFKTRIHRYLRPPPNP